MPAGEPDYIFWGGASVIAQPYAATGAQLASFACQGDEAAIQDLIERTLNAATSPGRFQTLLGPGVLVAALTADAIGSSTPPFSGWGTISETDIGFWLLVTDTTVPLSAYWFPVYLFVDNWIALVGGREVWGFPKVLATITAPGGILSGPIQVSTLALKTHNPATQAAPGEIFSITPEAPMAMKAFRAQGLHGMMLERAEDSALPGWATLLLSRLAAAFAPAPPFAADAATQGAMIFLKQIRDVSSPTAASYQAVVAAKAALIGLPQGIGLLGGGYRLSLADEASQPIASDLGLPLGDQPLYPLIWAKMDFTMELGTPVA
ncbi:MAG: acetoacetate decarboxylase family protein [Acetobacteraceae bacterium]|nr:acetoacetate decarboxylase family protein [Acetobacteraceae bacterium]